MDAPYEHLGVVLTTFEFFGFDSKRNSQLRARDQNNHGTYPVHDVGYAFAGMVSQMNHCGDLLIKERE
ncbi:MAG: hypothetical protein P8J33_14675 [Pirellulaceae bacterium]|nr:hypothetical protein [Pirellulaceae bacterium]